MIVKLVTKLLDMDTGLRERTPYTVMCNEKSDEFRER